MVNCLFVSKVLSIILVFHLCINAKPMWLMDDLTRFSFNYIMTSTVCACCPWPVHCLLVLWCVILSDITAFACHIMDYMNFPDFSLPALGRQALVLWHFWASVYGPQFGGSVPFCYLHKNVLQFLWCFLFYFIFISWVFCRKDLCEARTKMQSEFKFSENLSALCQMDSPLQMRIQVRLTFLSDLQVRLTFGQTYLLGWGFRSGWHLVRLLLRLTFGQMYPPARDISWPSVIPLWVRLTSGQIYPQAKTSCGQVWYYCRSGWHLVKCIPQVRLWVRLTFGQTSSIAFPICDYKSSSLV